jgi:hypothetical protein
MQTNRLPATLSLFGGGSTARKLVSEKRGLERFPCFEVVGVSSSGRLEVGGESYEDREPNTMRLFCFYNWKYTARCVLAEDKDTAKAIVIKAGHIRGNRFRRIQELTPADPNLDPRAAAALERVLATDQTGMAEYDEAAGEWRIRPI